KSRRTVSQSKTCSRAIWSRTSSGADQAMSLSEQNLLVVDDDDAFLDEAKRLLDGRLPVERSLEGALAAIEGGQLRMVLLGPSFANEASMNAIRAIHNAAPALILILIAPEVTADLLRSAMRVGISDVIEEPLDERKIEAAIEQFAGDVLERSRRVPAVPAQEDDSEVGKVVVVTSAKGGSGKTVTATNLALLLTRHQGKRVVLVDADLQFGDCCLVLQLEPRFTMVNAAHEMHHLDSAMLDSLLTEHPSGLKVLAAPLEPAFAD